jgi:Domain of unknown function (DUF5680)
MDTDNIRKLKLFLRKSHLFELEDTTTVTEEADSSSTIAFQDGPWHFRDNFFGTNPYGGHEVIHHDDKPMWIMTYYGKIHDTDLPTQDVHNFLFEALATSPEDLPFRGARSYHKGELEYRNEIHGDVSNFSGRESIWQNGQEIYWFTYAGGLVN